MDVLLAILALWFGMGSAGCASILGTDASKDGIRQTFKEAASNPGLTTLLFLFILVSGPFGLLLSILYSFAVIPKK